MTIPRYMALLEHWSQWPPVHKLVASWMGYKKKRREEKEPSIEEFIAAAKQFAGG